jgi:5'-nucleotidase
MKTVVDNERAVNKNVLFLDAGDQFQGTLFYTFFKGEKISYMMNNILKYDLMTIGNHEFDDGERFFDYLGL